MKARPDHVIGSDIAIPLLLFYQTETSYSELTAKRAKSLEPVTGRATSTILFVPSSVTVDIAADAVVQLPALGSVVYC